MNRSSTAARIITALIGLIVTPLALGLLSHAGSYANRMVMMAGGPSPGIEIMLEMAFGFIFGLLLLAAVVLTGRWSAAGLLAAGALGLITLVFAVVPFALLEFYSAASGILPRTWVDSTLYGLPLIILITLGAMGLSLVLMRHVAMSGAMSIVALFAAPILLGIGGWVLTWGIGEGQMQSAMRFSSEIAPLPAVATIFGLLLMIAGVLTTIWSRWSLVLPAVVLLVLSTPVMLLPTNPELFRGFATQVIGFHLLSFLALAGGVAVAVVQLTFPFAVGDPARRRIARFTAPRPGEFVGNPYADPAAPPFATGSYAVDPHAPYGGQPGAPTHLPPVTPPSDGR